MTIEYIRKFASDCCTVISNYQEMVGKLMAGNEMDQAKLQMDQAKLQKAASAVHELYGHPSKISTEQIVEFWSANPSAMADTITKIASERIEAGKVDGSALGTPIAKRASAEDTDNRSADEIFWSKYN